MKKRVVGAVVLIIIGVLLPLLLVRCLHDGGQGSDGSMRVYEITPEGQAQRADAPAKSTGDPTQTAGEETVQSERPEPANVDGATGVPRREDAKTDDDQAPMPDAISPSRDTAADRQPAQQPSQRSSTTDDKPRNASSSDEPSTGAASAQSQSSQTGGTSSLRRDASSGDGWVIQVASFSDEANAKRLAQRLSADFDVFYRAGDVDGKTYYRVRVGPFESESDAQATAARLRKQGRSTLVRRAE